MRIGSDPAPPALLCPASAAYGLARTYRSQAAGSALPLGGAVGSTRAAEGEAEGANAGDAYGDASDSESPADDSSSS